MKKLGLTFLLFSSLAGSGWTRPASESDLQKVRDYIKSSWTTLSRTHAQMLEAARDEKLAPGARYPVYLSPLEDLPRVSSQLRGEMPAEKYSHLELSKLADLQPPAQGGLLYLPLPYVVPGGRFNEMYGWDSYFIQLGLMEDHELQKASDMVENFLYEVKFYGKVLNANRSYYLTRSQPPFLSRMVRLMDTGTQRRAWPALEATYQLWTTPPHQPEKNGLSRYWDFGEGPAPEVLTGDKDAQGRTHYQRIADFLRDNPHQDIDTSEFFDRSRNQLTAAFYKGDRSMRESGFDPSNRFGPFNMDTVNYYPVDLNTLLWVFENDMAAMAPASGHDPAPWKERAQQRAALIQKLCWDEKDGTFYDYRFPTGQRRKYPFGTAFFPLWAGLATPSQAARMVKNLPQLEREGGLMTSPFKTGNQWDAPYGWAPLQLVAVQGLRKYGYQNEADRISVKWLSLVWEEFQRTHTIVEKYDVEKRTSQVKLEFGYTTNEIGFGWTNGAFLVMLNELSPQAHQALLRTVKL